MNKPVILIVEDDEDWRALLAGSISDLGEVAVAEDYATASALINGRSFDAIILDLRLEDQNDDDAQGLKVLADIRAAETGHNRLTNVIIVSAYGTPEQVRESFKIHFLFDYMAKQRFSRKEFREIVQQALTARR
jgi:DNA-binding NtrC family response regulator